MSDSVLLTQSCLTARALGRELFGSEMAFVAGAGFACRKPGGVAFRRLCVSANYKDDYVAALVVPTGIGAAIGGYAGDALPVARLLASVADVVVTHPNVLNGAQLFWPMENTLYVEGYALDQFAAGNWVLRPGGVRRVGVVLDAAIDSSLRLRHLQACDAARSTLGLNIAGYRVTSKPVGVNLKGEPANGSSWGTVESPDTLLDAARDLVVKNGCDAIAVIARFPEEDDEALEAYRHGSGVDAIAGAEAVISHLITQELQVPCAHAPALDPLDVDPDVSPRAAAEELGYTFAPCVLAGLSRAPLISTAAACSDSTSLSARDVDCLIVPATACGGSSFISLASERNAGKRLIIAVQENTTVLDVRPEDIFGPSVYDQEALGHAYPQVVVARTYLEAVGMVAAHRAGLPLTSLTAAGQGCIPNFGTG